MRERLYLIASGLLLILVMGLTLGVPVEGQQAPVFVTLQDAQTTGNGSEIDRRNSTLYNVCVLWGGSTSAGVISIEEASVSGSTDTWSQLTTVAWAAADTIECVHLGPSAYGPIRARISTTVVGGTVTVDARGNL